MSHESRIEDDLAIPGLAFRRFRGEDDFPAMVRIMTACNEIDRLEYNESVEDVAHVFEHLMNCDPSRDMLFAEIDGEPVAYSRVFWKDEQDGPRLYISLGFVVPAWRRRGLGTAILRWNEKHARKIAAEHPAGIEKLHHVWTTDAEPGAMALFAAFEYRTVRTLIEMTRPTSEPLAACSMPEGLEVRPAEPAHFRAVWEARRRRMRTTGVTRLGPRTTTLAGRRLASSSPSYGRSRGPAIRSREWPSTPSTSGAMSGSGCVEATPRTSSSVGRGGGAASRVRC